MSIPRWVVFAIAAWVLIFGSFRIVVAIRSRRRGDASEGARSYAMSWRRHLIFGALYVLLGAYLVAMGFGYGVHLPGLGGGEGGDAPESRPASGDAGADARPAASLVDRPRRVA